MFQNVLCECSLNVPTKSSTNVRYKCSLNVPMEGSRNVPFEYSLNIAAERSLNIPFEHSTGTFIEHSNGTFRKFHGNVHRTFREGIVLWGNQFVFETAKFLLAQSNNFLRGICFQNLKQLNYARFLEIQIQSQSQTYSSQIEISRYYRNSQRIHLQS